MQQEAGRQGRGSRGEDSRQARDSGERQGEG